MSQFIVSARKYRPDTFDSVVGQKSVTSTLKNAIRTEHLAHAYLFCGPRGVGKTTCARIFAKTINCQNLGSEIEACNECESCKSFNQNRSYNIHELDAASNNSVDDIRNLIDQVRVPPQLSRYSVYIIDEVHMLSQAAFNAFLKTLEEPPKHAVFILATTEKHKILPTILSRCQIFDFNRIRIQDIVDYLANIAKTEGVEYEEEALNVIAQKADGAMRDALSLFDQIVSFSENKINYQKVIENLNILGSENYFRLTSCFLEGDVAGVLTLFDELMSKGFDAHNFINGLSSHFRDLLVCKAEKTLSLLDVGDTLRRSYLEQAPQCSDTFLFDCLEICSNCDLNYKASKDPRLLVELALIKLCNQGQKKKDDKLSEGLELPDSETITPINQGKKSKTRVAEKTVSQPAETTPVKGRQGNFVTPSIKDALGAMNQTVTVKTNTEETNGKTEEEPSYEEENENPDSVTETPEDMWSRYIENIKNSEPMMYLALRNQNIKIDKDNLIHLLFRNNTQTEDFKHKIKQPLLNFLRSELSNPSLEILEELIEEEDAANTRHLRDNEKLKLLMDKNPAMKKLRKDFNLDLE